MIEYLPSVLRYTLNGMSSVPEEAPTFTIQGYQPQFYYVKPKAFPTPVVQETETVSPAVPQGGVSEKSTSSEAPTFTIQGYQPQFYYVKPKAFPTPVVQETETVSPAVPQGGVSEKSTSSEAQPTGTTFSGDKKQFVDTMTAAYAKVLAAKGLDTSYARALAVQDGLESAFGKSSLSKYNNFGGVKAYGNSPFVEKDTHEYRNGVRKNEKAKFRSFKTLDEYLNYKVNLLNGKRYKAFTGDPNKFYERVKAGGYATSIYYVEKLNNLLKQYS